MQLSLEGGVHLLDCLAQGSLVGMGVSGMEGVDVNWGIPVAGLSPGRNFSIGILIITCTGAIQFSLPTDGKNRVSPVSIFIVTPFLFPVSIYPLSAATLRERRW